MKTTTVRLSENTSVELAKDFENFTTAVQLILEPHRRLRKVVMKELKGLFSKEEITALVDSQNGVMLTPAFIYKKDFLIEQLEDFELFESGISRHGAEKEELIEKLSGISNSQVYFLLLEIHAFWNSGGKLDDFVKQFG
ncbi:hypothetical protein SAMN05443429_108101 [Cruoricaptor ignavus]|uniref:Uncharacterized protein n=1 Tax=Cruoricaptor ignavus TaxID=1118202 RepID=A0A1M6G8U1_9FLAO|nr:hypothetical protein [Cruoricaptor ignavus]SHJ06400.1 hypothetical protein SAMN05443429_108101 [Cruoricaptor ignavus]